MGLFDKLRGEFIDIIEWLDSSTDILAYRFERHQNEIKNGARLIVRESQIAVFINEGKIADIFNPGTYTLTTANLPLLSTLQGWKHGFNSPFKAEVYFISTRNITAQKWGTKNAITVNDNRFGMVEIRAFGTYVIRVKEPVLFIKEIVGTDGYFTADKINEQLKSIIVARFTDAAGESNLPVDAYAANLNEVSDYVREVMKAEFESYGIELTKFIIENVSMPDEIKKEIFDYSRLNAVDLDKLTKFKAAKSIEIAADNDGTAGAGLGYAVAGMVGNLFTGSKNENQSQNIPPAVPPALTFFVVINGEQAGPYDMNSLKQMAAQGQLTKETLVWQAGMENWTPAGKLTHLSSVFGSVPPPIPQ